MGGGRVWAALASAVLLVALASGQGACLAQLSGVILSKDKVRRITSLVTAMPSSIKGFCKKGLLFSTIKVPQCLDPECSS